MSLIVGWNDSTSLVSSITDSKGNLYQLAVGPTVLTGSVSLSQAVYYAKNISAAAAGANSVTVKFNAAATAIDLRILEYSGVDPVNAAGCQRRRHRQQRHHQQRRGAHQECQTTS